MTRTTTGRQHAGHRRRRTVLTVVAAAVLVAGIPSTAAAHHPKPPVATELATFAAPGCTVGCGSGSTIGPDGALYATEPKSGRIVRVDVRRGTVTEFARGLPIAEQATGGAMDVAFVGRTAYTLVSLVGPFFGHPEVVNGIYRRERNGSWTVIADIGAWSVAHPPATGFFIAEGVQYAMQATRNGFLVTDGHHNRVLHVGLDGTIDQLIAFGNVVPTGLAVAGRTVFVAQAGPIPHLPENGRIVAVRPRSTTATLVASGASLLVDVELAAGHDLYAVSQGVWDLPDLPENEGQPASADSGKLVRVERNGELRTVVDGLDRPTSLELVGDTAFVITLTGTVIRIDHATGSH